MLWSPDLLTSPDNQAEPSGTLATLTILFFLQGRNRYFILKSINAENIQRAVAEGIWATQRHNEPKLNEAFRNSENVYLIFSVNASGHFQVGLLCVSVLNCQAPHCIASAPSLQRSQVQQVLCTWLP